MLLKNTYRKLKEYFFDGEIDIDRRLSAFFVLIGVVDTFLGGLLGLIVHLPKMTILLASSLTVLNVLFLWITKKLHKEMFAGYLIAGVLLVTMPVVWVKSGGIFSGALIWMVFVFFYMAFFAQKKELPVCMLLTFLMDMICVNIELLHPEIIFRFQTTQDQFISIFGSLLIFTASIFCVLYMQKCLCKFEKRESDSKRNVTLEFITTIATIIDAKDNYTGGHSKRVAECAVAIAKEMGMSKTEQNEMRVVGLLHDIGKVGIPDSVLNKPGRLTDSEYELIKRHPMIGAEILKTLYFIPHVYEGALYHHERYDGEGYPIGLRGEEIPLFARIICIADSFDAMSTSRIYRKNVGRDEIIAEFERCRGKQFDPKITDCFIEMLKKGYETRDELISSDIDSHLAYMLNSQAAAVKTKEALQREQFVIDAMRNAGRYNGALNLDYLEFSRMYEYLKKMGIRFEHETILVLLRMKEDQTEGLSMNDLSRAANALQKAIISNVRGVDVCTKYSETEFLLILIDATQENLAGILSRVERSYRTISDTNSPDMEYQVLKYPEEMN